MAIVQKSGHLAQLGSLNSIMRQNHGFSACRMLHIAQVYLNFSLLLLNLYLNCIRLEELITFLTNIEQCCDTIEVTSTTNAGHSGLGTYTRESYDNDGRAVYFNGRRYLYWLSLYDIWGVSNKRTVPKLCFV